MGLRSPIKAVVAVLVSSLLVGATASAATARSKVVFRGAGSYVLRYTKTNGEAFRLSATFAFRTVIPNASFTEGRAGVRELASLRASGYSGSWSASVIQGGASRCHGTGRFGDPGHGAAVPALVYSWSSNSGVFSVDSFNGLPGDRMVTTDRHANDCSAQLATGSAGSSASSDFWLDWVEGFSRTPRLRTRFHFPGSLLSSATVTESVSTIGSSFPGACRSMSFKTCTQSYKWNGAVQFTREG